LIFREYGLPLAIRSDNGTPFAGRSIGGLSRLMIWLILLGIIPERIRKGCPQENGRHERMHRTLKSDALNPIARNLKEQQKAFDIFRHDYNNDRPHESLHDQTPSELL
jgi:transposase InsO family protein